MDEARYREMVKRNAKLEERVKELEKEQVKKDPAYVPEGVDRDLMYDDRYVEAAYNPQPPPRGSWTFLKILLIVGGIAFAIWLVFIKRWGGSAADEEDEKEEEEEERPSDEGESDEGESGGGRYDDRPRGGRI
jgi:hypothetical protein